MEELLVRDETKIWKQLNLGMNPEQILTDWASELTLQADDKESNVSYFCLAMNSANWQWLNDRVGYLLDEEITIHWGVLAKIWLETEALTSTLIKSLIKAAKKTNSSNYLIGFRDSKFQQNALEDLRAKQILQLENQASDRRQELEDRLIFFKDQQLLKEEQKILNQGLLFYPEDSFWKKWKIDFDKRWAASLLSQSAQKSLFVQERTQTAFDLKEQEFLNLLAEATQSHCEMNSSTCYDFAIGFVFMGAYAEALNCLHRESLTPREVWLKAELLLKDHRFVEALEFCNEIEKSFSDLPETAFSSCYLKAQALYGLGDRLNALELLEGLVSVRPDYRSAEIMLRRWKEGDH